MFMCHNEEGQCCPPPPPPFIRLGTGTVRVQTVTDLNIQSLVLTFIDC